MNEHCPFCGAQPYVLAETENIKATARCLNARCPIARHGMTLDEWNTRASAEPATSCILHRDLPSGHELRWKCEVCTALNVQALLGLFTVKT